LKFTDSKNLSIYSHRLDDYVNTSLLIKFNNIDLIENHELDKHTILLTNTFFNDFRDDDTSLPQESEVLDKFLFLRQSTITSFFIVNMIDMPICFKKSKSLYSKTFELPLLKFINLIMRKGLREKTLKSTTLSFFNFFNKFFSKAVINYNKWRSIYTFLLNTYTTNTSVLNSHFSTKPLDLNSRHVLTEKGLSFNSSLFFKKNLFDKLGDYIPLFSFYIRKVDKSIRKNSRGKSGKYMIIWKYVPSYKRLYVTMRWFLKDLKFQKLKTFDERLIKTIETFLLTPELSFVCKLRRFTHFFVFQNHKKTLLKTLKSTS
jgi:hypothetical protein